jgi:uncharacterized glyoxalase superfamily protein PhnB
MAAKKKTKAKGKAKARTASARRAKPVAKRPAAKAKAKTKAKVPSVRDGLSLSDVAPGFTVNDIHSSLAWYRDVLGFEVGERWERDGVLRGVELRAGKTMLMLGQDDWKKGRDRIKGQGVRMYCTTRQDIDELASRILKAGWKLTQEPKDQPWGTRDIALDDPDGYHLTLAQQK